MNYLFAGKLIAERLKTTVPEFKEVLNAGSLAQISRETQQTPAAYVIYAGDVINTEPAAHGSVGKAQYIKQQWIVVIVAHLADKRSLYQDGEELAGKLITQSLQTLSGYQLNERSKPMTRSSKMMSAEYDDGWGYYPYLFNVEFVMPRAK